MDTSKKKTCIVKKLSDIQMSSLKQLLNSKDWEIQEAEHCYFKGKSKNISVAAYLSGKLVIQGNDAEDFVLFVLEPEILKEDAFSKGNMIAEVKEKPFYAHAGIDESGKGDFFGPLVVACAFVQDADTAKRLEDIDVKDSKLIKNDRKIQMIAKQIIAILNGKIGIVMIGPEAYNNLYDKFSSLNKLLAWGHARALENLLLKAPECKMALADKFGDESLIKRALFKNGREIKLEQRTKAESDIAVAAASILARSEFVRRLDFLGEQYACKLPKGAGNEVDRVAATLAATGGKELLEKVAKAHFRTMRKALGLPI